MTTRLLRAGLTALLLAVSAQAGAAVCVKDAEVCVEGPETRLVQGQPVYRECWRTTSTYICLSPEVRDDCGPLRARGCSQVDSRCVESTAQGLCTVFEQSWRCRTASATSNTVTNCGDRRFCLNGYCFDVSHSPDPDFARAVAGMEVMREAGRYIDPDTLEVFQGYDNRCRRKLFGLLNCCKGGGAGGSMLSTMNLISGAAGRAIGAAGSSYTYDALFAADAPDMVIAGFEALFGAGGGSSALAGLIAGELSVGSFMTSLIPGPWSIAMLAIQLSGLLECEQAEQILAMKNDNRLCHSIGTYCSRKVRIIGTCLETTQSFCCFNSRLARLVHEQGRAQLGRGWGNDRSPDCSGFSMEQLQALDFGRMDLSEFYAEIAPTLPDSGALAEKARSRLNSYFSR